MRCGPRSNSPAVFRAVSAAVVQPHRKGVATSRDEGEENKDSFLEEGFYTERESGTQLNASKNEQLRAASPHGQLLAMEVQAPVNRIIRRFETQNWISLPFHYNNFLKSIEARDKEQQALTILHNT